MAPFPFNLHKISELGKISELWWWCCLDKKNGHRHWIQVFSSER